MTTPSFVTAVSKSGTFASSEFINGIASGSGNNRVAMAIVCMYNQSVNLPGDATLGGVTMTKHANQYSGTMNSNFTTYTLDRASMPTGSVNFVVDTSSAGGLAKCFIMLFIYDNVNVDIGAPTYVSGQTFTPQVNVNSAAGRQVAVGMILPSGYTTTAGGSAVERYEIDYPSSFSTRIYDEGAVSSVLNVDAAASGLSFTPGWVCFGWDLQPTVTAAENVTLTGPSSGNVASASTAFTVGVDGSPTGTITVTPNDGGAGGSFSPSSVNITSVSLTATFTYTPTTTGARTIALTNNGGLGDASLSYTANAIAPAIVTSPANQSVVTGQQATFSASFSGIPTPTIKWQLDAGSTGAWVDIPGVVSGTFTTTATTVTGGAYNNGDRVRALGSNIAGSNVATAPANLTVTAAGDNTVPTWPSGAAITTSNVTASAFTMTVPTATDNVAVTSYEYSINGGSTYVSNGLLTTKTINSGLTPGATLQLRWRAKDAAGNVSVEMTSAVTLSNTGANVGPFDSAGGTPWPVGTAVHYSYYPNGRIGSLAGITPIEGNGSLGVNGTLTIQGLPSGSGVVICNKRHASDSALDMVYEQPLTVA